MSGSRRDAAAGCSRGGDDKDEPPSRPRDENTHLDRGRIEPQHIPSPRSLDSKQVPLRRENGAANSYVGGRGARTDGPRTAEAVRGVRVESVREGCTTAPRERLRDGVVERVDDGRVQRESMPRRVSAVTWAEG